MSDGKEGKEESKGGGGGGKDGEEELPVIEVTRLSAEPADADVSDALSLEMDFTSSGPITNAVWEIKVSAALSAPVAAVTAVCSAGTVSAAASLACSRTHREHCGVDEHFRCVFAVHGGLDKQATHYWYASAHRRPVEPIRPNESQLTLACERGQF